MHKLLFLLNIRENEYMILAVLAGVFFTILIPLIYKISEKYAGWIISSVPLGIFIYFSQFYNKVAGGGVYEISYSWIPSLGINLDFYIDGLSLTFALIITLVGFAVFLYAGTYLKGNDNIQRLYVYLLLFMSAMLGLVTSNNLMSLFVFWELTSISSYLLIGFKHEKERSRYAALQALFITGLGGLALLAGFIFLNYVTGTWQITELSNLNDTIVDSKYYVIIVLLILTGAFTKSAQFPFHFWLPNAMEAPTPISAYLHSATMVKAGIYLIARLNQSLGGTDLWQYIILFTGAFTMIFAAVLSFRQTDLKKLLAYSTLSVLGTLVMLLGIGNDLAIKAFFIFLIAHSLYKGTLFLVAGIIDHETGTRDIRVLSGLFKFMPATAVVAGLASLSKMGIVPLVGFIGKETVYASALEFTDFGFLFIILAIAANIFIVYITISTGFRPFTGEYNPTPKVPEQPPIEMIFGPMVLASAGLILGIFPKLVINNLINFTELGIINKNLNIPVKLWHGFNLELGLSILTVALGFLVYIYREKLSKVFDVFYDNKLLTLVWYYDKLMIFIAWSAKSTSRFFQNGYLSLYVTTIIVTTLVLAGLSLADVDTSGISLSFSGINVFDIALGIAIFSGAAVAVSTSSRMNAIIAIGVVGFSIALVFIVYSAPDLALTQFAIEVLTVILFVLVLYRLPKFLTFTKPLKKIRDIIVSVLFGGMMTFITLLITSKPLNSQLKEFFIEKSLPEGKGSNVVNVILVDFRAFDTLGEITVLAIAAVGVVALLSYSGRKVL